MGMRGFGAALLLGWGLGWAGASSQAAEPDEATTAAAPLHVDRVRSDPAALATVARDLLRFRGAHPDDPAVLAGPPGLDATLRWVVSVAEADRGAAHQRLQDPDFLARSLRWSPWTSDVDAAARRGITLAPDQIRLTKYLAWELAGSPTRDAAHPCALYAVPNDERGLTEAEAEGAPALLRRQLTRAQVLDGAFLPGGVAAGQAEPLVWLSRSAVHEALMQGTVVVRFPDGAQRTFNVHRNNGMPWVPAYARDPERQRRFWYMREVDGLLGYGGDDKVALAPQVVVAGDVLAFGLGALIGLVWEEAGERQLQLVWLADSGGAFAENRFQLDWLVGVYADRAQFVREADVIPDRVSAGFVSAP